MTLPNTSDWLLWRAHGSMLYDGLSTISMGLLLLLRCRYLTEVSWVNAMH